jgi:hypothetical protein
VQTSLTVDAIVLPLANKTAMAWNISHLSLYLWLASLRPFKACVSRNSVMTTIIAFLWSPFNDFHPRATDLSGSFSLTKTDAGLNNDRVCEGDIKKQIPLTIKPLLCFDSSIPDYVQSGEALKRIPVKMWRKEENYCYVMKHLLTFHRLITPSTCSRCDYIFINDSFWHNIKM